MSKRNITMGILILVIIIGLSIALPLLLKKKGGDDSENIKIQQADTEGVGKDTQDDEDTDDEDEGKDILDKKPEQLPLVKYIAPMTFEVGLMKLDKCQFANNTNPDVLYPINGLSPDYGNKMPDYCPCMEFIQSP